MASSQMPAARPPRLAPYCFKKCNVSTSQTSGPTGWLEMKVIHKPLTGITSQMMIWWLNNVDGDMVNPKDGKSYQRQLMWHPRDHVQHITTKPGPTPGSALGASWYIAELFAAKKAKGYVSKDNSCRWKSQYYANIDVVIDRLDASGWSFLVRFSVDAVPALGVPAFTFVAFRETHEWADSPDGLQLNSTQLIGTKDPPYPGADSSIHGIVNSQTRLQYGGTDSVKAGQMWIRHCLEEMANLKSVIPLIYPKSR